MPDLSVTDCLWYLSLIGRGQAALNKKESIEEGLKNEESFFNNTEPWRSVEDRNLLLAGLQMNLIRSSFKGIVTDLKEKRDQAVTEYQALGDIPASIEQKRSLFRSVREEIWNGVSSQTLDGRISSLRNSTGMRPSAEFHEASHRFQDTLNSSKLATVSDVALARR